MPTRGFLVLGRLFLAQLSGNMTQVHVFVDQGL